MKSAHFYPKSTKELAHKITTLIWAPAEMHLEDIYAHSVIANKILIIQTWI